MKPAPVALTLAFTLTGCLSLHPEPNDHGPARPTDTFLPSGPGEEFDLDRAPVRFVGTTAGLAGIDVDFVGDLDGDGFDDVVIADRDYHLPSGERRGGVHLIYGRAGLTGDFPLERADATFAADTYTPGDLTASAAGDVDGDGYDDFLMAGTFVFWGGPTRYAGVHDASSVATHITGGAGARDVVAGGGDLDGDGLADVVIASWATASDGDGPGTVYVFYGREDRFISGTRLEGADAVLARASDGDVLFGRSLAAGGDVDGDGFDDVLIGAPSQVRTPGEAWLFRGGPQRWSGPMTTAAATSLVSRAEVGPLLGLTVAFVGDLDGDGFDEFAIGDPYAPTGSQIHVIYGRADGFDDSTDLASADFTYVGNAHDSNLGAGLSQGAGDVNGDGFADLFVGSPNSPDATQRGHCFVILGGPAAFGGMLDTSSYDVRLTGTIDNDNGTDQAGYALAHGGDFDGDGRDDLLVGAHGNRIGDRYGGRAYLVFGR